MNKFLLNIFVELLSKAAHLSFEMLVHAAFDKLSVSKFIGALKIVCLFYFSQGVFKNVSDNGFATFTT